MLKTFFPIVLDSTQLESMSCPIRFFHNHVQHISQGSNVHLRAGRAFATGIQTVREHFYNHKQSLHDSISAGIAALEAEYGDTYFEYNPEKSVSRMALALETYFYEFDPRYDDVQPLELSDGTYSIEYSLMEEIKDLDGSPILHPILQVPLLFSGRLDLLAEYAGKSFIVDEKTTGGYFSDSWSKQWETRGQFSAYCLTEAHEVLTRNGWVSIKDLTKEEQIICWDNGNLFFDTPFDYPEFDYNGNLISIDGKVSLLGTPDHRQLVFDTYTQKYKTYTLHTLPKNNGSLRFVVTGDKIDGISLEENLLKLIVATQADGHFDESGNLKFSFIKERKIYRLLEILDNLDVGYSITKPKNGDSTKTAIVIKNKEIIFNIKQYLIGKDKTFSNSLLDLSKVSLEIFLLELAYWDGSKQKGNTFIYCSTNLINIDFVQTIAALCGWNSSVHFQQYKEHWKPCGRVVFSNRQKPAVHIASYDTVPYSGKVYCVSVPSSYFLIRHDKKIMVTGNCWLGKQSKHEELQKLNGAIIRGISLPKAASKDIEKQLAFYNSSDNIRFTHCMTNRNDFEVECWHRDMIKKVKAMVEAYTAYIKSDRKHPELFFSGNWGSECTNYGNACKYQETCKSPYGNNFLDSSEQYIWRPEYHTRQKLDDFLQELGLEAV